MRLPFAVLALLATVPALAADGPFGSPGFPVTSDAAPPEAPAARRAAPLPIRAYRRATRFHGPRCPHRPSCSAYAAEAMARHGVVLGSFIGAARLLRGTRSSALRPLDRDPDGALLDPLPESTFFLEDRGR